MGFSRHQPKLRARRGVVRGWDWLREPPGAATPEPGPVPCMPPFRLLPAPPIQCPPNEDSRLRWPRPPKPVSHAAASPVSQPKEPEPGSDSASRPGALLPAGTGTRSTPREQGGTHLRTAGPPEPAGTGTPRPAGCPPSWGPPCPRAPEPKSRKVRGPAARAANSRQRSARRPLARSALGPQRRLAPGGGKQRWAGPADATPRAPPPPNRLLPGHRAAQLAWVVVGADWLWGLAPRPASDRITWKHKTRLRSLVVELSAGSKPPPSAEEEEAGEAGLRPPSPHARAPEPSGPASRAGLAGAASSWSKPRFLRVVLGG